ncbi:hypothetical protein BDV98DRAFT_585132 [Pterulicium gracile]|uniref:Uncharacterized protein n=1 Tax=Pterulicium gracile TaxID=1884261 RepID=A0A5C3Q8F9_9AGAR|nr:hypothetical protein BDV98DRAFT_585132 [Pterula gracilis]
MKLSSIAASDVPQNTANNVLYAIGIWSGNLAEVNTQLLPMYCTVASKEYRRSNGITGEELSTRDPSTAGTSPMAKGQADETQLKTRARWKVDTSMLDACACVDAVFPEDTERVDQELGRRRPIKGIDLFSGPLRGYQEQLYATLAFLVIAGAGASTRELSTPSDYHRRARSCDDRGSPGLCISWEARKRGSRTSKKPSVLLEENRRRATQLSSPTSSSA